MLKVFSTANNGRRGGRYQDGAGNRMVTPFRGDGIMLHDAALLRPFPLRYHHRRGDTMGMPATVPYYTLDEVLAFPADGNRYELVFGELLVSPTPRLRHQRVVNRLYDALKPYCEREGLGEVFAVPADLSWGRSDVLTQPDVFVLPPEYRSGAEWADVRHVPLVAEVLSPSTARYDRFNKRLAYRDVGVPTYWILDADAHVAEVWTRDAHFPRIERESLLWHPACASAPLMIDLMALFAE